MSIDESLAGLAELYNTLGRRLVRLNTRGDALAALSELAVEVLVPAQEAGITRARDDHFSTVTATGDLALAVDRIQYDLRQGPCVSAAEYGLTFRSDDLRNDGQWPEFGHLAFDRTGVISMLSVRVYDEDDDTPAGVALNMYSSEPAAFDERDTLIAELLASHGALALATAAARERVTNLEIALQTNRAIGVAIGVLMSQYKLTQESAFDLLRMASQHSHRKLADVAQTVVETGAIELPS